MAHPSFELVLPARLNAEDDSREREGVAVDVGKFGVVSPVARARILGRELGGQVESLEDGPVAVGARLEAAVIQEVHAD